MTPEEVLSPLANGLVRPDLPPVVFAYGFSMRKRTLLRCFLGEVQVRFVRSGSRVPQGSVLLLWGSAPAPSGLARDVRLIRLEDGFLRSVGLGADLTPPVSWVMDQRGIYYDASQPSDLESLLQTADFPEYLLERAARLRNHIVESGLTKYNVGSGEWMRPLPSSGQAGGVAMQRESQRVILVPGQVETDASLRFGAPGISTNIGLLQAVRNAEPDAFIIYKPHPDVVAGLRGRGRGEDTAQQWCDEVVTSVAMHELLSRVDEVHVLTSLTGFEALLRTRSVTCYGRPFYAGWGLTNDHEPIERRTRRLTLDMLVAGALILYPVYSSRATGRRMTPEQAIDELLQWREADAAESSWLHKAYRYALRKILSRP